MGRALAAVVLALMALVPACGASDDTSALEARIRELEQQIAMESSTTATSTTTSTTAIVVATTTSTAATSRGDDACWEYWSSLAQLRDRYLSLMRAGHSEVSKILEDGRITVSDEPAARSLSGLSTDMLLVAVETKDLGFGVEPGYTEHARRLFIAATSASDAMGSMASGVTRDNVYIWNDGVSEFGDAVTEANDFPALPGPLAGCKEEQ